MGTVSSKVAGMTQTTDTAPVPRPPENRGRRDAYAIREWALSQGHKVGATGRLPKQVVELYDAAHPEGTPTT